MGKYFNQALEITKQIAISYLEDEPEKKKKTKKTKTKKTKAENTETEKNNKDKKGYNPEGQKGGVSGAKKLGSPAKLTSAVEKDAMKRYVSEGTATAVSVDNKKDKNDKKAAPTKNLQKGYNTAAPTKNLQKGYNTAAVTTRPLKKSSASHHTMGGMSWKDGQSPMKKISGTSASPLKEPVTLAIIAGVSLLAGGIMDSAAADKAHERSEKIRKEQEKTRKKELAFDRKAAATSDLAAHHSNKSAGYLSKMVAPS